MPQTRDELAKQLIEAGKAKGYSQDEIRTRLNSALAEFDSFQTQKETNVPQEKLGELRKYRDVGQTPGLTPGQQFRADFFSAPYKNIEEDPTLATRAVRGISNAAPGIFGTVSGALARGATAASPASRGIGAVAAGAGYGAGLAFGEGLENMVGIQDETPAELAKEAVVEPIEVGVADYALDWGFDKAGNLVKKGVSTLGKGISKAGEATGATKLAEKIVKPVKKVIEDDFVSRFDSTKGIRKAIRERGINIVDALKRADYTDDPIENIAIANRNKSTVGNIINSKLSRYTDETIDLGRIAKKTAEEVKKSGTARTKEQLSAIDGWLDARPKNGSLIDAFWEKVAAGKSGYKNGPAAAPKDSLVGELETKYERKIYEAIKNNLSKEDKAAYEALNKIYEEASVLESLFENAADSNKPLSIKRIIGRLTSPITIGKEVAGTAGQAAVRKSPDIYQGTTNFIKKIPSSIFKSGAASFGVDQLNNGGGSEYQPKNTVIDQIVESMEEVDPYLASDQESISKVASVLQKAGITDLDSQSAKNTIKKITRVIKDSEKMQNKKHTDDRTMSDLQSLSGMEIDNAISNNQGMELGAFSLEGVPLYK